MLEDGLAEFFRQLTMSKKERIGFALSSGIIWILGMIFISIRVNNADPLQSLIGYTIAGLFFIIGLYFFLRFYKKS